MKKLIGILMITAILAACNNKYKASSESRADSLKMIKDSLTLDSFKRVEATKIEAEQAEQTTVTKETVVYKNTTTAAPAKKGISSAAKGAIIGGAAGAVGGAIISKDNTKGAIIGGVAGAGAGYLIGRDKDKKTGRVQ
jgi:hypothetical protein